MNKVKKHELEDLYRKKGLTVNGFAKAIGVTRQTIWAVKNGKSRPGLELLVKMAEVLGVKLNTIIKIFE